MKRIFIFGTVLFFYKCATFPPFPFPESSYEFPETNIKLITRISGGALTRIYETDPYLMYDYDKINKHLIGGRRLKEIISKFLKDRNCEIVENEFDLTIFIQLELLTVIPGEENSVSYIVIYCEMSSNDKKNLLKKWYYFKRKYSITDYNSLYRNRNLIVSGLLIDFMKKFEKDLYKVIKSIM